MNRESKVRSWISKVKLKISSSSKEPGAAPVAGATSVAAPAPLSQPALPATSTSKPVLTASFSPIAATTPDEPTSLAALTPFLEPPRTAPGEPPTVPEQPPAPSSSPTTASAPVKIPPAAKNPIHVLKGHTAQVTSLAFYPDGRHLASSSGQTIRIWDTSTWSPVQDHSFPDCIFGIAIQPTSDTQTEPLLGAGFFNSTLRVWDNVRTEPCSSTLYASAYSPTSTNWAKYIYKDAVGSVAFSQSGDHVATGGRDKVIHIFTSISGWPTLKLTGHEDSVTSLSFSHSPSEAHLLLSGSRDKTLRLWDTRSDTPLVRTIAGCQGVIRDVAFSPDGWKVASAAEEKTAVRVWDVRNGEQLYDVGTTQWGSVAVEFSPSGKYLVWGGQDGFVRVCDALAGREIVELSGGESGEGLGKGVRSVAWSRGGRVVAGFGDGNVMVWDVSDLEPAIPQEQAEAVVSGDILVEAAIVAGPTSPSLPNTTKPASTPISHPPPKPHPTSTASAHPPSKPTPAPFRQTSAPQERIVTNSVTLARLQPDLYRYDPRPTKTNSLPAYPTASAWMEATFTTQTEYYPAPEADFNPTNVSKTKKMSHYFSPGLSKDEERRCYMCLGAIRGSGADSCRCR